MKKLNNPIHFILLIFSFVFFACNNGATNDRVSEMVVKINRKCPAMVDEETQLKNVAFDHKQTITYTYRLVHLMQEQVDTAAFRKALWPGLLANIKVDHELKDLRDGQYSFVYAYEDKNNKPIYQFLISAANYK